MKCLQSVQEQGEEIEPDVVDIGMAVKDKDKKTPAVNEGEPRAGRCPKDGA